MKKFTALTLGIVFLTTGLLFAQQAPTTTQTTSQATAKPAEVGNKTCPVSGGPVTGVMSDKPVKYEYKGKIYNLCCPGCLSAFKKNPEKYSKIAEDNAKAGK